MARVVHFEIPADDPDCVDEPGIDGGLMKREHSGQGVCNTVGVDSVEEYVNKMTEAGGTIVVPKSPIPGVGYVAYGQDLDGNVFGIFEQNDSAVAE